MKTKHFAQAAIILLISFCIFNTCRAQNSLTGDGFGGRSWYVAHNYQAGAYTAFTVCGVNNQLYGWGGNHYRELGNGTYTPSFVPVAIPGMTDVKFYSTGYVSAAIKYNKQAWVWGDISPSLYLPTFVLDDVKFVDAGISHVVFIKNDSTVWALGQNYHGELGNGTTVPVYTVPVQMTGVSNAVRAIAVGDGSYPAASIILIADGTVKITGGYEWFSPVNNTTAVTIPGLTNIVDIKGGTIAAYALNAAGEVYSFGRDILLSPLRSLGLGPGNFFSYTAPTKITFPVGAAPIVALSANNDGGFALALDENKNVYGWGDNRIGQLGLGVTGNISSPILIATNAIDIMAGEIFSYILKADSSLWASGGSSAFWTYDTGSIWMNLPNIERHVFTQIDPTIPPMNLCDPKDFGVVPIGLVSFSGKANGSTVNLTWTSADETGRNRYVLEYSANGNAFHEIATLGARGSNSSYYYAHQNVSGKAFYRLKMVNNDDAYTYSEIRSFKLIQQPGLSISPNPAKDVIHVLINIDCIINTTEILSVDGTILRKINIANGNSININGLSPGTYILKITDNKYGTRYGRFIKM